MSMYPGIGKTFEGRAHIAFKHLPQPLRSHNRSFRSLRRFLNFCPTHYVIVQGEGGHRRYFFIGISIIKWHTGACKISKSYDNFSIFSPPNMSGGLDFFFDWNVVLSVTKDHMQKIKILRQIFNFFTPQYLIVRGVGGMSWFFLIGMLFYW